MGVPSSSHPSNTSSVETNCPGRQAGEPSGPSSGEWITASSGSRRNPRATISPGWGWEIRMRRIPHASRRPSLASCQALSPTCGRASAVTVTPNGSARVFRRGASTLGFAGVS